MVFNDTKYITYQEAVIVGSFFRKSQMTGLEDLKLFLSEFGIDTSHKYNCFYNHNSKVSYLFILDLKKWFLAKIKYGI